MAGTADGELQVAIMPHKVLQWPTGGVYHTSCIVIIFASRDVRQRANRLGRIR